MQGSKKESDISIGKSRSNSGLSYQSWWSSIESHCPESALSQDSSLKMGVPAQHYQGMKLLDFSLQDQDSCSTQSTGQSYSRVASFGDIDLKTQTLSFTQPDNNATHDHPEGPENKFTSSLGPQNYILPPLQAAGYNQTYPQLAVSFPDQHFSNMMSPYGPQSLVMGGMPGRVPLPLDHSTNEPIYVNAKQYRGILRRRQHRAKLEAQNKLVKNRKPYLHESRHQHALKRARGSGGRFLNSKQLEEARSASADAADGHKNSGSISLHQGTNNLEAGFYQQKHYREGTSTPTGSDVTSTSTSDDLYHPSEFRFYDYSSRIGQPMQGGGGNYL